MKFLKLREPGVDPVEAANTAIEFSRAAFEQRRARLVFNIQQAELGLPLLDPSTGKEINYVAVLRLADQLRQAREKCNEAAGEILADAYMARPLPGRPRAEYQDAYLTRLERGIESLVRCVENALQ